MTNATGTFPTSKTQSASIETALMMVCPRGDATEGRTGHEEHPVNNNSMP